ncbi:hypothetical protein C8Q69DRAFT_446810 [Paecilomyces variotii]|uniref:Uncharacterized protein n=1 Tax=Byssochlamys spectabilis TaxID=264951 RepID=A0A443HNB4_BYSSP|nr:hypothetical protein C8Q69DRAFT_446810 [Paecilomyces variotii]RWQ93316.1 hypothetical protein C8Q69DRAFT_446810 [Paecilomyces variotii]
MPPRSKKVKTTAPNHHTQALIGNHVEMRPLNPDDPEFKDEENDVSFSVQPEVIIPCFEAITTSLVENLHLEVWKEFDILSYWGHIEMLGGLKAVVSETLRCIHPKIRSLEGKRVTPQTDPAHWPAHSGYLSYVKDLRNSQYWRAYVGQSSKPAHRIKQHMDAYFKRDQSTLHYYILSKARSHRSMGFIPLWSIPLSDSDESETCRHLLLSNVLEMVMCRAFQTLSNAALQKFFGDADKSEYANVGLNILPPLLQGLEVSFEDSPDPQVQQWPKVRQEQLHSFIRSSNNLERRIQRKVNGDYYKIALAKAIEGYDLPNPIQDFAEINLVSSQPEDMHAFLSNSAALIESALEDQVIRSVHSKLIQKSNLRVILLCGLNAERSIVSPGLSPIKIELQGYSYSAYIELKETGAEIKRLYVRLPFSLTSLRSTNWRQCMQFGELLRFVTVILDTKEIRGYSMANQSVYRFIITQYADERDSKCDPMTIGTLDPILLDWLALKGIVHQDAILEFAKLGGSMIRGILLLLVSLPRKPKGTYPCSKRELYQGHETRIPLFSLEQLERSRRLYRKTRVSLHSSEKSNSLSSGSQPDSTQLNNAGLEDAELDDALMRSQKLDEILKEPALLDDVLKEDVFEDLEEYNVESLLQNQASAAFSDDQDPDDEGADDPRSLYYRPRISLNAMKELLNGRFYKGKNCIRPPNTFQINVWEVNLIISNQDKDIDFDRGFVVTMDISPPGIRNPNVYVATALDSDPASRVAFNVTATSNSGERISIYPQSTKRNKKEIFQN